MIHRYEIDSSVMYDGKVTDLQSAIIPAHSLEEANKKLQSEVKRRLGKCRVKIDHTSLLVSEDSLANSKAFSFGNGHESFLKRFHLNGDF
ncbi:hypothetical protein [Bacillus sp. FSL K6-2944]|uniref:hypothetical protein n=1 Tax=Bacillus sp. FSL K6-2944 TaxID=2921486 RepID=UPI0030F92062